ncbi:hypothetical protein JQ615_13090 [Bradyrhizobium jicamae]|uniref:Outer membrane protein beta-barrel domain-containing protein n=1 Tax=Bradyrhizobium jicamae TaxID=280332 RepID=A0ABS5FHQ5_9BRAD|nr:hypothetical protein [Bradyrhizobium jicamae]MBR0796322.1 hypothetical protein [Bradyrhizobium jicamae]MBR0932460.1 hypothetical protein [Bradyrhizobium jicamae]
MSSFARKYGLAIVMAMLCLGGQHASAQSGPVRYWLPGGLFGFGGTPPSSTYGDFPGFDAGNGQGGSGFSYLSSNLPTGWFGAGERGGLGLNGAFGNYSYDGAQVGYNFKGAGDMPVTFFAGFDSLRYNPPGAGGPLAPFSSSSSVPAGFAARAGLEFRPTSNVTLQLGATFVQSGSERMDSDINSPLLPGQSPLFFGR